MAVVKSSLRCFRPISVQKFTVDCFSCITSGLSWESEESWNFLLRFSCKVSCYANFVRILTSCGWLYRKWGREEEMYHFLAVLTV